MTYQSLVLSSSPEAYYRFEESSGSYQYADSSGNGHHIERLIDESSVASGIVRGSNRARVSDSGMSTGFSLSSVDGLTIETSFQATVEGTYVLVDSIGSGSSIGVRVLLEEDISNPGEYLLKFGLGVDNWTFDVPTGQCVSVYSDNVSELFNGKNHHLVFRWDGTPGVNWDAEDLSIIVDGMGRDNAATRSTSSGPYTTPPINLSPLYITGPASSPADHVAAYDEFAIYAYALPDSDIIDHFNNTSVVQTVVELDQVDSLVTFTGYVLRTVREYDYPHPVTFEVPTLLIESTSTVTVEGTTSAETLDTLAGREVLGSEGTLTTTLTDTTLEPDEPNPQGFYGTKWYEIPFDAETTTLAYIEVPSNDPVGFEVYKDSGYTPELGDDEFNLDEPTFVDLVAVPVDYSTGLFELDEAYEGPYYLQLGTWNPGATNECVVIWGDADPGPGGSFDSAIQVSGPVGAPIYISSRNAWLEPGEPLSTTVSDRYSMWVEWESPSSATPVVLNVSGPVSTAFSVEVYTGTDFSDLLSVVSGYEGTTGNLQIEFSADPDTIYYIRIATDLIEPTQFTVSWGRPTEPYVSKEPVNHLRVTVHAGVMGGSWAGRSHAPNELITELPNRSGAQFQESLNVPGSGSVSVQVNDPVLMAFNPAGWPSTPNGEFDDYQAMWSVDPYDLFRFGNIVKFWMGEECISGFIIKSRDVNIVGAGDDADRIITVSGPTVHALLADFVVDHISENMMGEERAFNWASISGEEDNWDNGGWFDATGTFQTNRKAWNHPINASSMQDPPGWGKKKTEGPKQRPKYALTALKKRKWPDHRAKWLWMSQKAANNQPNSTGASFPPKRIKIDGQHYYRTKALRFTGGMKWYRFTVHSDTYYEVYLDGELFMSGNGNEDYTRYQQSRIWIDRGDPKDNPHTIAVAVEDRKSWVKVKGKKKKKPKKKKIDLDHNDAFIMTVHELNIKGKVKKHVLRSNKVHWYAWHGPNPPGWSRAMVLKTLIEEARDRGNSSALAINLPTNFGKVSAEGTKWYDTKEYNALLEVGMSVIDVQASFSESLRFDVWIDPDDLTLYAYQGSNRGAFGRGTDKSYNVALVPGHNLVNWSTSEEDSIKNVLIVKAKNGYTYSSFDKSIARYGAREGYVELGGIKTDAAGSLGNAILSSLVEPESLGLSEDVVGHRNETYSGSVIPVRGAVPFLDWNVGDTISAPASNGLLRPHRVLSITCTEDQEGNLGFDPELSVGTFEYKEQGGVPG